MTFRFLSFGAGVQTTALLLMDSYDEVIFADTKGEWPETYEYLEKFTLPYVKGKGIKFTVLGEAITKSGITTASLEDFCHERKTTPSMQFRWCTETFKIKRIVKYLREQGYPKPMVSVMGISFEELGRMHKSHSRTYDFAYPLVDKRMTRKDCQQTIQNFGWPLPPKSGCFYCPFQNLKKWKELYLKHPELYGRADAIERLSKTYPKHSLHGGPTLAKLAIRFGQGNSSLDDFETEPCDSGYCMT